MINNKELSFQHCIQVLTIILSLLLVILMIYIICKEKENLNKYENMTDTTGEQKEQDMLTTLKDAKKSLDTANINFFLACGTALGAIRENKFISYDGDIDLGVFKSDVKKDDILKIISIFENNNFTFYRKFGEFNHGFEITFKHTKTNINVDIFIVYEDIDLATNTKFWWVASYTGACDNFKYGKCRYKNTPFDLDKTSFYNMTFNVPPEKYLVESYGADWKIPKQFSYDEGISDGYTNIIKE